MLGRLVLCLIQLGVGWFAAPKLIALVNLPKLGSLTIFVYAVVFAVLVWLLGVVGALVLKDVAKPSPSTLAVALLGAVILAGMTLFPDIMRAINGVVPGVPERAFPLIGAVLGYAIKR